VMSEFSHLARWIAWQGYLAAPVIARNGPSVSRSGCF
jgi:hypothetical protein